MPRVGLNTDQVVLAGAVLADEVGIGLVSFATLAKQLNVQAPALYKHVDGIDDLIHRIATLAMNEFVDRLRNALQGKSGVDAVDALFKEMQTYVAKHPGRYMSINSAKLLGNDDPLLLATTRFIDSIRAILSGYGIQSKDQDHAIRMLRSLIHGYASLQGEKAFHWSNDPRETITWMISFVDTGLTAIGSRAADR